MVCELRCANADACIGWMAIFGREVSQEYGA
jgi:hypothetical protein